jgi:hypothetical protein
MFCIADAESEIITYFLLKAHIWIELIALSETGMRRRGERMIK